jgi:hypothetical protein
MSSTRTKYFTITYFIISRKLSPLKKKQKKISIIEEILHNNLFSSKKSSLITYEHKKTSTKVESTKCVQHTNAGKQTKFIAQFFKQR